MHRVPQQVAVTTEELADVETNQHQPVIIIVGMAVANSINKADTMKTFQDLSKLFLTIICNMTTSCNEVSTGTERHH